MKTIIWFEMRKIMDRKINRIAMGLGILFIIIVNMVSICGESITIDDGTELKGIAAINSKIESENSLTTELSEEYLTDFIQKYQEKSNGGFDYSLIKQAPNLYPLIADHYAEFRKDWEWEDLNRISTVNGARFYENRIEKIDKVLNADYSYGNYTDKEKEYWLEKAESINTPFKWGSREAWDNIWKSICFLCFELVVISVCIAPVFAGEIYYRTDSLLFCSKNGRTKLVHAKIIAAFVVTVFYMMVCCLTGSLIHVAIFGIDGWDLPVQLWNTIIPYQLNAAQACMLNLIIIILLAALLTGISLFISAACKNQVAVLAIDMLVFFGTVFLQSSKTSRLWNHICYLFPLHVVDMRDVLKTYNSYQIAGHVYSYIEMIIIVYIVFTVLFTIFAGHIFKKHQVA